MPIKFLGVKWPVQEVYEAQKRKNTNPGDKWMYDFNVFIAFHFDVLSVRKRRVLEPSPGADSPVKRSKRESRPSKKLQEADLENLGFSPKHAKSLKVSVLIYTATVPITHVCTHTLMSLQCTAQIVTWYGIEGISDAKDVTPIFRKTSESEFWEESVNLMRAERRLARICVK